MSASIPRLALLLALLASEARAQSVVVTLDEALALARDRSAAVLQAAAQADGAQAELSLVRASRWPSVTASAGAGQRYGLAFDQTAGGLTQETVEALDASLFAQAVVYDGGARRARVRSAQAGIAAAEAGEDVARMRASVEALAGLLAIAQADATAAVARADAEAQARVLIEVETLVEFGVRPASEVAGQRERLAAAQGTVLDADAARALATAQLASLLGLDPDQTYDFPPPTLEAAPDAEARTTSDRADVRASEAAVHVARAEVAVARAHRRPEVSLVGGLGTSFTSAGSGAVPFQLGTNRAGQLGLQVSLPLLDRGAARAGTRQASARLAAAESAAAETARLAALDVRQAALALTATEAQIEIAAVRLDAARTALGAETARYQAGETTLQTVAQTRARVVDAETRQAVLRVTAQIQRVQLRVLSGE